MFSWTDPIGFASTITTRLRNLLTALEIRTMGDLLSHTPRRYEDYSRMVPIAKLEDGIPVSVVGRVAEIENVKSPRSRMVMTKMTLEDETGMIDCTWFNQPWLEKQIKKGQEGYICGEVRRHPKFGRGFATPIWEPKSGEITIAGSIVPVYPLTEGLTQKAIRQLIRSFLREVALPDDPIPDALRLSAGLCSIGEGLRWMHVPVQMEQTEYARRRRAFGELFCYRVAMGISKARAVKRGSPKFQFQESFAKAFVAGLPFDLTTDQKKAIWACVKDLESGIPMRRLIQGDVGSGKTVIGAMLGALVWRSGGSAAFMAPTDLLAKQHAETIRRYTAAFHVPVLCLTGTQRWLREGSEEKSLTALEARDRIAQGRLFVVGTHALLTPGQCPKDLVLAVVDEQHRFGVSQREALATTVRQDGLVPHLLSMTATPIPRSLALTVFGDLSISVVQAKPAGRLPIRTMVGQGMRGREKAYATVRDEIAKKHRAFIVCPLIDPSDTLGVRSVESEARRLSAGPLRGLRLAMVHGKLPVKEKDALMQAFTAGEVDVLIATTVIEVGVNVPEATVMVIEGAERFGLAQLHQLRGRVGRSTLQSFCFLIASDTASSTDRLRILERTNDGFVIAEEDLKQRGQGDLFGTSQSGEANFPSVLVQDVDLMNAARDGAAILLDEDPELASHPALRLRVEEMFQTRHGE